MIARVAGHLRRDLALLTILGVLLVGVALLSQSGRSPRSNGAPSPTLSVHSTREDGARALFLWLADLGYRPAPIEYRPFAIGREARLLFVLAPTNDLSEPEVEAIGRWVRRGGTLVFVADRSSRLLDWLGVEIKQRPRQLTEAVARQPVFLDPPLKRVVVEAAAALRLLQPEWVPILGAAEPDGDLVAAVAAIGAGRAFVLTAEHALSNGGLGHADNWLLVRQILAGVPAGSVVAFDEYHHGLTERGTLATRLVEEPWGWAILYGAGLIFAYVALSGRRFGRAIPLLAGRRRSRGEYVATLAALLHQGKHRDWLRQQYVGQVKRSLGSRFRVRGDLPATAFVAVLAGQRPEALALAAPLERLEREGQVDDAAVVALMAEVDRVRARLVGSG